VSTKWIVGETPWAYWRAMVLLKQGKRVKLKPESSAFESRWLYLSDLDLQLLRELKLWSSEYDDLLTPYQWTLHTPQGKITLGSNETANILELTRKGFFPHTLNHFSGETIMSLAHDWVKWSVRDEKYKRRPFEPKLMSDFKPIFSLLEDLAEPGRLDHKEKLLRLALSLSALSESCVKYDFNSHEWWPFFFNLISPWYKVERAALMNWQKKSLSEDVVVDDFNIDDKGEEEWFIWDGIIGERGLQEQLIISQLEVENEHLEISSVEPWGSPEPFSGLKGVWFHQWKDRYKKAKASSYIKFEPIDSPKDSKLRYLKTPHIQKVGGRLGYMRSFLSSP
jgi:hypothetical protein